MYRNNIRFYIRIKKKEKENYPLITPIGLTCQSCHGVRSALTAAQKNRKRKLPFNNAHWFNLPILPWRA